MSHTGKLYSLLAARIARKLADGLAGVDEAYCFLLSRIGSPVSEPQLADVALRVAEPGAIEPLRRDAARIVREELRAAGSLWREVLAGQCAVC